MRLIPLLAAATLTATAFAQPRQQKPQPLLPGTSTIRGIVTDATSKEPVAGCIVRAGTVRGTPGPATTRNSSVVTGPDGAFEFAGIAEDSYFVATDCPSHLFGCIQSTEPGRPCRSVALFKDQQRVLDFQVTLGATVKGRVIDSAGKPIARVAVRMGGPFLGNTLMFNEGATTADDGSFEIKRMATGLWSFEVDVPPPPGAYRSPLVYYPGVLKRDEAGFVEVAAGKVTDGIVITVPPVLDRTLTVRIPPPDSTMTEVNVSVVRAEPLMSRRLEIDAEGRAEVKGLMDGRYVVMATAIAGQERWADYQAIDFINDSIDVALQLRPTGRIRGRIVADKGGIPPLDGASIGAVWVDSDVLLNPLAPEEGTVALDGSFEIAGLFGRRMLQLGRFDPDWRIHAVMQGKSDVTTTGIDVAPDATAEVTILVRRR
jgi:hypothetical protein